MEWEGGGAVVCVENDSTGSQAHTYNEYKNSLERLLLPLSMAESTHPPTCQRECTGRWLAGQLQQSHLAAGTEEEVQGKQIQLRTKCRKERDFNVPSSSTIMSHDVT